MTHLKSRVLRDVLLDSSMLCFNCANKVFKQGVIRTSGNPNSFSAITSCRSMFTTTTLKGLAKKDFYAEEKLPTHGALGLHTLLRPVEDNHKRMLYMQRPVRHTFGDKHAITDIAAGHGFTLISVKPKKENDPVLFGCGYNKKSQLGYQPGFRDIPLGVLISIVPIPLPLNKTTKVLALGAGRGHSLVSVEGKGIISLGENTFGQCGRQIIEDEDYEGSKYICRIPAFGSGPEHDVVQIASRFDVSVCLTRMGTVYTFGCNMHGQLGRGKDVSKPWVPAQLQGDLKGVTIKKVATSGCSALAVSESGQLFGWGYNDCGQVDPSQISNIFYEPVHVKLPRRVGKIVDVAMGNMFQFVVNEFGNVYAWGQGCSLGLGPKNLLVKTPTIMPPPLFGRNEFSPDVAVVKVEASFEFASAVNSIGDVYTWGKNNDGCLGIGRLKSDYQFFPFQVPFGGPAHKVSLGADHVLIMTKAGF
ncbi:unnamed protein product [Orchesella dallaii]|uniref:Williams-Beuren syndrome chromosomal region 16 protein n=1 Tax=Orchesella dallaii TaxID=48710 RepID=A0ABP1QF44_9HEXA